MLCMSIMYYVVCIVSLRNIANNNIISLCCFRLNYIKNVYFFPIFFIIIQLYSSQKDTRDVQLRYLLNKPSQIFFKVYFTIIYIYLFERFVMTLIIINIFYEVLIIFISIYIYIYTQLNIFSKIRGIIYLLMNYYTQYITWILLYFHFLKFHKVQYKYKDKYICTIYNKKNDRLYKEY